MIGPIVNDRGHDLRFRTGLKRAEPEAAKPEPPPKGRISKATPADQTV